MLPTSLEEAIKSGSRLYFDGTTCSNGHVAPRRWGKSRLKGEIRVTTKCEECRRANRAKHRHDDIAARKRSLINALIRSRLSGRKRRKSVSNAEVLLGCTIESYMQYIESRWDEDMTWDNWGKTWEIDHIRACHTFDLTNERDLLTCFNWINTRPLTKPLNYWRG